METRWGRVTAGPKEPEEPRPENHRNRGEFVLVSEIWGFQTPILEQQSREYYYHHIDR